MSMLKDKMQINNKTTPKTIRVGQPLFYQDKLGNFRKTSDNTLIKVESKTFSQYKKEKQ